MKPNMLDRHDLDALEKEYGELYLAELTDDVDCSLSTFTRRNNRLEEIETLVGWPLAEAWSKQVQEKAKKVGYASGKPWDGD